MWGVAKHASLQDIARYLGTEGSNYRIFSTFREPLDWVRSQYTYVRTRPRHPCHEVIKYQSFSEFATQYIDNKCRLQSDFIRPGPEGRSIDCIVQLESFDSVAPVLFEFLGILDIPAALPCLNSSNRQDDIQLPSLLQRKLEDYLEPDLAIHESLRENKGIHFSHRAGQNVCTS